MSQGWAYRPEREDNETHRILYSDRESTTPTYYAMFATLKWFGSEALRNSGLFAV